MKPKSKNFIIPLVIYPFDVMVSVDETDEQLLNHIKDFDNITVEERKSVTNLHHTLSAIAVVFDCNYTLVRLFTDRYQGNFTALIAHELFHATTNILNRMGIRHHIDTSDEAYAYLFQYLLEKTLDKLDANKKDK